MIDESRKRINLLWRIKDCEQLARVRGKLQAESDAETLRRALKIAEAVIDGKATIDGRSVVVPV